MVTVSGDSDSFYMYVGAIYHKGHFSEKIEIFLIWIHVSKRKRLLITMTENTTEFQQQTKKCSLQYDVKGILLRSIPSLLFHWILKINSVKFNIHTDPLLITLEEVFIYQVSTLVAYLWLINFSDDKVRLRIQ